MANRWLPGVPDDRRRTFILACPHAYRDLNSTIFKQKAQLTGNQQKTRGVAMKSKSIPAVVIILVSLAVLVLAVLGGRAISAQDTAQAKYAVRVPNGLAFNYDAASDMFTPGTLADDPPQGNDAKCGLACHTIVKTRDYVFTDYGKR